MQSSIVTKLLSLLNVVSEAQKPMAFSEIVEKTGLNKSTIHRLLAIGVQEQMLRQDPHKRVYFLGPRVFDWVRNAYDGYDVQAVALDEMTRLFELFRANVTIGVPAGNEVVYLRILESPESMRGLQRPGMRDPIHCSASGKALFANQPDSIIDMLLEDYEFKRHTARTAGSLSEFKTELAFVREHGFGKNDREEYDNVLGISAPVFNYVGEAIAVLNIWSVYPNHKMDDLLGWAAELKTAAGNVTSLIGGVAPESAPAK